MPRVDPWHRGLRWDALYHLGRLVVLELPLDSFKGLGHVLDFYMFSNILSSLDYFDWSYGIESVDFCEEQPHTRMGSSKHRFKGGYQLHNSKR